MSAIDVCYCILILSGAFALIALGLLLIRSSGAVKEATVLMQMSEETIKKVNLILDDINHKLELLDTPVQFVDRIFTKGAMKSGVFSAVGLLTSFFKK